MILSRRKFLSTSIAAALTPILPRISNAATTDCNSVITYAIGSKENFNILGGSFYSHIIEETKATKVLYQRDTLIALAEFEDLKAKIHQLSSQAVNLESAASSSKRHAFIQLAFAVLNTTVLVISILAITLKSIGLGALAAGASVLIGGGSVAYAIHRSVTQGNIDWVSFSTFTVDRFLLTAGSITSTLGKILAKGMAIVSILTGYIAASVEGVSARKMQLDAKKVRTHIESIRRIIPDEISDVQSYRRFKIKSMDSTIEAINSLYYLYKPYDFRTPCLYRIHESTASQSNEIPLG